MMLLPGCALIVPIEIYMLADLQNNSSSNGIVCREASSTSTYFAVAREEEYSRREFAENAKDAVSAMSHGK
jgi:hypothetical protein